MRQVADTLRLPLLTVVVAWLAASALVLLETVAERLGPAEMRASTTTDSPGIALAVTLFVLYPALVGGGWSALALRSRGRRHAFRLGAIAGLLGALVLLAGLLTQRRWAYGYYAALLLVPVIGPLAALATAPMWTLPEARPGGTRSPVAHILAAIVLPLGIYGGFRTMAELLG